MPQVKFPKGSRVRYSKSFLRSWAGLLEADVSGLRGTVVSIPFPDEGVFEYRFVKWDGGSSGYVLSNNLELTGD